MKIPDPAASQAVFIGAGSFEQLSELPTVAESVRSVSNALAVDGWKLPPENISVLQKVDTPRGVSQEVRSSAERATDTLFVYYSGHGLVDVGGKFYLAVSSSDPGSVHDTALPYEWVSHAIRHTRARRRIVVLDCCFSARAFRAQSGRLSEIAQIDGTYLIAAASETGVAITVDGETVTAFSGAFLKTVKSGIPKAGECLTLNEVYRDVRFNLLARGLPEPQSQDGNQIGDLPFIANQAFDSAIHKIRLKPTPLAVSRIDFKIPLKSRSWRDFTPKILAGSDPTNSPEYWQVMKAWGKVYNKWESVRAELRVSHWMPDNRGKRIVKLTEDERWMVVAENVKTLENQSNVVAAHAGNIGYYVPSSRGRIPTSSGAQTFERLAEQLCGQIDELMCEYRNARNAYRKTLGK
jgi:hypothetical protein